MSKLKKTTDTPKKARSLHEVDGRLGISMRRTRGGWEGECKIAGVYGCAKTFDDALNAVVSGIRLAFRSQGEKSPIGKLCNSPGENS